MERNLPVLPQPRRWGLWVVLLAAVVSIVGFVMKGSPGATAGEFVVDQDLSRAHDGFFNGIALTINYGFAPLGAVLITLAIAFWVFVIRHQKWLAVAFVGTVFSGWVTSIFFKHLVSRQRPNPSLLADPLSPETGFTSFPSGHVAFTVALVCGFYLLLRKTRWVRLVVIAGALLALVVAWSRVYVGVHYPSDVLASFLVAPCGVILFSGVVNALLARWGHAAPRNQQVRESL